MDTSAVNGSARIAVVIARLFVLASILALVGAWAVGATGVPIVGLDQQHLSNDAIVFALLGIAVFIDAYWHARRV